MNVNDHALKSATDLEKDAFIFFNERTDHMEELVKRAEPIVSRAEDEARELERMNKSVSIVVDGITFLMDSDAHGDITLTDMLETAAAKKEEVRLTKYLTRKYGAGTKLSINAFMTETHFTLNQAHNCYQSLHVKRPEGFAMFSITDTVMILQLISVVTDG